MFAALFGLGCSAAPPPPPAPPPPSLPPAVQEEGCVPDPPFGDLPREFEEDVYAALTAAPTTQVYDPDDPVDAARSCWRKGRKAQVEEQWIAAWESFREGWGHVKTPHIAVELAGIETRLRHPKEALFYAAFVLRSKDPKITEAQRKDMERLRAEAEARIAKLDVDGEPGACLLVDGLIVGHLPLKGSLAVNPGRRHIETRHLRKRAESYAELREAEVKKVALPSLSPPAGR